MESDVAQDQVLEEVFWLAAISLAIDKIVDVRIGMARLLSLVCGACPKFMDINFA